MKAVEGTANEFTNDSMDEIVLSGDSSGSSDEGAGLRIAQNVKRKNVPADKINVGPEEMQSFCLTIRRVKELETVLVQQSNVHKVPGRYMQRAYAGISSDKSSCFIAGSNACISHN